ncbi:sensor domain-containing phosphodiesterase [Vreelandella arcis]|uniref:PAS domain S-box-containing protein/diguanylate cyclase (GGDEF) domain-containing protein n=1 Tax=Vreelandella arcis TaxID=416873 RepID=A0A1H0CW62_9GAMM|nr:EAL domain-containing protein [Halomonas arcis]SDN62085.1 PAS domain S-box-containing protein/diguanylate cyclase (GGDEF) domain-containing protein [Halomonas arcis]
MVTPAGNHNEAQRLFTLKRYTLGDRTANPELDRITRLAATHCHVPIALITLVDEEHTWCKSRYGDTASSTPREHSFSTHTIACSSLVEVSDAQQDSRFENLPLVVQPPGIRFYAGVPLITANGHAIGSLCVMDTTPRQLTSSQRELLTQLGNNVVLQFEQHLTSREQHATRQAGIGVWEMDIPSRVTHYNDVINQLYGISKDADSDMFRRLNVYVDADKQRLIKALKSAVEHRRAFNDIFQLVTPQGLQRWVRITGQPVLINGHVAQLIGTMIDVTPRKRIESQLLKQQALERAIMRAQSSFIDERDNTFALKHLLDDLLTLTDSEYGFIGEVLKDEQQAPYLVAHAITDITWDDESRRFYEQNAPNGMMFSNLNTLFGYVMRYEEVVIANQPALDPRRGGLPPGHPQLAAFLGVPIHLHGQCIAMIGLANRPNGYDRVLVDFLAPLLGSIGQLINNLRINRQQREDQTAIARLSMVAKKTSNGVVITDAQGRIEWVNEGFTRSSGYKLEDAQGKTPGELLHGPKTDPATIARITQALQLKHSFEEELLNYRRDGSPYWVHISGNPLPGGDNGHQGFIAIQSDISDTKAHEEALYKAANIDELTGLANQRLTKEKLALYIQGVTGDKPINIHVLNLDDFKRLNELLGYHAGNKLLVSVAQRLAQLTNEEGFSGRLSGDEFAVVTHSAITASSLQQRIQETLYLAGQPIKLTTCVGTTSYPLDNSDSDTLIRHAYQALYQAKTLGHSQHAVYNPDEEQSTRSKLMKRKAIRHGLAHDEFQLFYQPQVNLKSHRVIGVEALIRWQHPEKGLLSPADFLPLIEGTDLEYDLGEWVIEAALKQQTLWQQQSIQMRVSVNISPRHLLHPGFLPQLQSLLNAYPHIEPNRLSLEILESATLDDMQAALTVLSACQALGIDVALDDFGTGYSSLAYFRRLPVQLIKVDRDFVRDMLESQDDRAIVESIVFLAKKFSRPVLAEGVETMAHASALLALGCYLAQGYGIARPMPALEIPQWLEQWRIMPH